MKLRDAAPASNDYFNNKILLTLIKEVQIIFKRKLLTQAINFHFRLNDAQAITLYKFIMEHPVPAIELYLLNLRQHVCDVLHKQF